MIHKFWKLLIGLLCVFVSTNAQITRYEDSMGTKGVIAHQSPLQDSLLPQNGKLDIKWRQVYPNHIQAFQIIGQTKDHIPIGKWTWEEAKWNYNIAAGANAQPLFWTYGIRKKWDGQFVNGQANGIWHFTIDSIGEDKKSIVNLSKIQMQYKNGVPFAAFTLEDNYKGNGLKLKGLLDANGIAIGIWQIQYFSSGQLIKEERHYKNGLLIKAVITKGNVRSEIPLHHNQTLLEQYEGKESKLSTQIGTVHFNNDEYPTEGTQVITQLLQNQFQQGWHLDVFPYEVQLAIPSFLRIEYPITESEIIDIQNSQSLIASQLSSIENVLTENVLLHRSKSGTLDTAFAYLQLQQTRLSIIDSLLSRTKAPLFSYNNRNQQGLQKWFELLNANRTAKGAVYDSLQVVISEVNIPAQAINVFQSLNRMLIENGTNLESYFSIISDADLNIKRQGILQLKEAEMLQHFLKLQEVYEGKEGITAVIYSKWIKGDVQSLIQTYANTQNYDSALQIGNTIDAYLNRLDTLYLQIDTFDQMPKNLQTQYTHLVYNPYTGINDIEVITKRRFLQNVLSQMWPYMNTQLQSTNDWTEWNQMWNQQFSVYHFLLSYIPKEDKASKKLENKVRRESKPDKMLKTILNHIDS